MITKYFPLLDKKCRRLSNINPNFTRIILYSSSSPPSILNLKYLYLYNS